jgi:ribosomal protein S12 methylthiotransferase accessory factor
MLHRPQFKPHFHAEIVEGKGVFLLSEQAQFVLRGRLHELVAPWLDGRHSLTAIVEHLRDQASAAELYYTVAQLEQKGYLAESQTLPAGEAAFWTLQDIAPQTAARRLAETPVSVTALGDVQAEPLRDMLRSLHVQVGEQGRLGVVLTDDYLRSGLESCNRQALAGGRPWLLVKPVGGQVWLGPLFRPGTTGCWECLAQRLRANREVEVFVQQQRGGTEPFPVARSWTSATLQIAWGLAATQIAAWVVRGELPGWEGKLVSFDLRSCQTQSHFLVKRPQCAACGRPEDRPGMSGRPVVLQSRHKNFTQDGGHRIVTPQETLERYQHHVSAITGVVRVLQRAAGAVDGVIHAYLASNNGARRHSSLSELRTSLGSTSGGKGATDVQARASGLCEALERTSGIFRGDEPRRKARLKDLGEAAIVPNACMLFSDRQYQERGTWNAKTSRPHHVPVRFDEEAEVDWTPVWSLTRRQQRYLPTAFCYYGYPFPTEGAYCAACSNGNAAGNTLEEAILQGLLELIERDSVALWWYNRARRPGVDLDSFDDPYLRRLRSFLRGRGRDLWALDLTADLQVPAFAALSHRTEQLPGHLLYGFGAHLDPHIALLRAVTELGQMLAYRLPEEANPPVEAPLDDRDTRNWLDTTTLANQPYLTPAEGTPPRRASDFRRCWSDDLREDVRSCQVLVERHGMEMLVLDQTRSDIGLPVVKVIVPGLRHFWARFAPGRLYDVPVRLGWLPQPLAEEELNPVPMFL